MRSDASIDARLLMKFRGHDAVELCKLGRAA
jgi:hypothetical protein